jgi:hypothetical protein
MDFMCAIGVLVGLRKPIRLLGDQRYFSKIVNVSVRWRIYVVISLRRKAVHDRCKKRISERSDEKDERIRGCVLSQEVVGLSIRNAKTPLYAIM